MAVVIWHIDWISVCYCSLCKYDWRILFRFLSVKSTDNRDLSISVVILTRWSFNLAFLYIYNHKYFDESESKEMSLSSNNFTREIINRIYFSSVTFEPEFDRGPLVTF